MKGGRQQTVTLSYKALRRATAENSKEKNKSRAQFRKLHGRKNRRRKEALGLDLVISFGARHQQYEVVL